MTSRAFACVAAIMALTASARTQEPAGDTELREGDEVVIYGLPSDLENAEAVLLAG
ncbi:MAG: hypothetical protein ACXWJ6_16750 [Xanthobacteraceae bacterium]